MGTASSHTTGNKSRSREVQVQVQRLEPQPRRPIPRLVHESDGDYSRRFTITHTLNDLFNVYSGNSIEFARRIQEWGSITASCIPSPEWNYMQCKAWIVRYHTEKVGCCQLSVVVKDVLAFKESGVGMLAMRREEWVRLIGRSSGVLSLFVKVGRPGSCGRGRGEGPWGEECAAV